MRGQRGQADLGSDTEMSQVDLTAVPLWPN
jgi:hypothetical protein